MSGRKSWPAPDPLHVWVGSGFRFLIIIFGLSRVGLSFLVRVKISARARPVVRVGSGRVFSAGSGQAAHDQV
jgi:hypothetical protein